MNTDRIRDAVAEILAAAEVTDEDVEQFRQRWLSAPTSHQTNTVVVQANDDDGTPKSMYAVGPHMSVAMNLASGYAIRVYWQPLHQRLTINEGW